MASDSGRRRGGDGGAAGESAASPAPSTDGQLRAGEPLQLSSESLASDVESQLPLRRPTARARERRAATVVPEDASSCATAAPQAYGVGEFFAAFYDGIPALLVLRPAEGDSQRADVLACDTAEQLDSVELPAP